MPRSTAPATAPRKTGTNPRAASKTRAKQPAARKTAAQKLAAKKPAPKPRVSTPKPQTSPAKPAAKRASSAANKTQPTRADVAAYLAAVPDATRRADAQVLADLMHQVTGEPATLWGPSIVGFGTRHYVYDSGREGDTPLLAFSPRKAALVLYGLIGSAGASPLLAKLGKHSTGKGCLYLKRLADVDLRVLEALIRAAYARRPKA